MHFNKKIVIITAVLVLFMAIATVTAADVEDASDSQQETLTTPQSADTDISTLATATQKEDNNEKVEQPTRQTIDVTPSDYNTILGNGPQNGTTYNFKNGDFTLGVKTFEHMNNVVFTSTNKDARFVDTTFYINGSNILISNLKFNNTNNPTSDSAITVYDSYNVNITGIKIGIYKTSGPVHGIKILQTDTARIEYNNVTVTGQPQGMGWNNESGEWAGAVAVSGIVLGNSPNIEVNYNNFTVKNTTQPFDGFYTTAEGVTVKASGSTQISVYGNNITVTGSQYNYGTTVSADASHVSFVSNHFNVTGERYVCGLQFDNVKYTNAFSNTINLYTKEGTVPLGTSEEALAYGVIATCWSSARSLQNGISSNTITITANAAYGIEAYLVKEDAINGNNILIHAKKAIGIAGKGSSQCNLTGNTIKLNTTGEAVHGFIEEIPISTTGIKWISGNLNNIKNNKIYINTSTTTGINTIDLSGNNNNITGNKLTVTDGTTTVSGSTTMSISGSGNYQDNNENPSPGFAIPNSNTNILSQLSMTKSVKQDGDDDKEELTFVQGVENIRVKYREKFTGFRWISVIDEYWDDYTSQLKYDFYMDDEFIATITTADGVFKLDFSSLDISKKVGNFSGVLRINDSQYKGETTFKIEVYPVNKLVIETTEIPLSTQATINITINVYSDTGEVVNDGKIIFKVGGKYLRDDSGKLISADIVDGVATYENLTVSLKATYYPESRGVLFDADLTAIVVKSSLMPANYNTSYGLSSNDWDYDGDSLILDDVSASVGETIIVKVKLNNTDDLNNGKMVLKVNGKTVKDVDTGKLYVKVVDGEATFTYALPKSLKAGDYVIKALFTSGEHKLEAESTLTVE